MPEPIKPTPAPAAKPAAATPPKPAGEPFQFPRIEEILLAKGYTQDHINEVLHNLARRFPGIPIPEAEIQRVIDGWLANANIEAKLREALEAWDKLRRTGKGPVAHDNSALA